MHQAHSTRHTYTQHSSVFPCLFAKFSKQNHRHTCTHTHANTSPLPPHKHFLSHLTQVFAGLTDCLHMQQHVLRLSRSSSKQIATTQTENMYSAPSSSLQSLASLFKVFPHWEGKNALFCHIFLSPRLRFCVYHVTKHCSFHKAQDSVNENGADFIRVMLWFMSDRPVRKTNQNPADTTFCSFRSSRSCTSIKPT